MEEDSSDDTLSLDLEVDLRMMSQKRHRKVKEEERVVEEPVWKIDKATGKIDASFVITK